jgi:hypothetical protein
VIEHTITATREELIAELERVKAQRDDALRELDYHRDRVCGEFEMNGHCSCIPKAIRILEASK